PLQEGRVEPKKEKVAGRYRQATLPIETFEPCQVGCQLKAQRTAADLTRDPARCILVSDAAGAQVGDGRIQVEPGEGQGLRAAALDVRTASNHDAQPWQRCLQRLEQLPDVGDVTGALPLHLLECVEHEQDWLIARPEGGDQSGEVADGSS